MKMKILHARQLLLDFSAYAAYCHGSFTCLIKPQTHKGNFPIILWNIFRILQGVNLIIITSFLCYLSVIIMVAEFPVSEPLPMLFPFRLFQYLRQSIAEIYSERMGREIWHEVCGTGDYKST